MLLNYIKSLIKMYMKILILMLICIRLIIKRKLFKKIDLEINLGKEVRVIEVKILISRVRVIIKENNIKNRRIIKRII